MLQNEKYVQRGDTYFMDKSKYNKQETHTAMKLGVAGKNGYYTVFPNNHQINEIKKLLGDRTLNRNDVFLFDKKTYYMQKADLKAIGRGSLEAIRDHIIQGTAQAPVVVLDISIQTSRWNVIKGIQAGWDKRSTKLILLNWRGQWYQIDKDKVLGKKKVYRNWLEDNIK
jgi:hypothetical protein